MDAGTGFKRGLVLSGLLLLDLTACGGGSGGSGGEQAEAFRIVSVTPIEDSSTVPVDTKIEMKFSRPIAEASLQQNLFALHGMIDHRPVRGTLKYEDDSYTAIFTPLTHLDYETHYMVSLHHNVTDQSGTHLHETFEWTFFTASPPPRLTSHEPRDKATEVSPDVTIRVRFENEMDASTLNSSSFRLSDTNGQSIAGGIKYEDGVATFKPGATLALNTTYRVTLTTDVADTTGTPLDEALTWSFTTSATSSSTLQLGTLAADYIQAMTTDDDGNIYLAGGTFGEMETGQMQGGGDVIVIKYDKQRRQQWLRQFGTEQFEVANAVAVAADGSVYIAGFTSGSLDGETRGAGFPGNADMFLAKFNDQGDRQWIRQLASSKGSEILFGVAIDPDGNIYVAGNVDEGVMEGETALGGTDIVIARYDGEGNRTLLRQLGSDAPDFVRDLGIDSAGNLYLAGSSSGQIGEAVSAGFDDALLLSLDAKGDLRWARMLGNTDFDFAAKLVVDTNDDVFITGAISQPFTQNTPGNLNAFVAKYDGEGTRQWSKEWGGEGFEEASDVATDNLGNVYVAGGRQDFFLAPPPPSPVGDPGRPPEHIMRVVVSKFRNDGERRGEISVPAVNHAQATAVDWTSQGILVAGRSHGGVGGNTLIGEEDGFLTVFDSSTSFD